MARGVGDNELALVGGEEPVGDIDGDALLALGGEAVHQQREVDLAALRADLPGVRLQGRQLVLEDHLGVVEQAADQRRLAVVHRAAGEKPQQRLVLMGVEIGLDVLGDKVGAGHFELGGHQNPPPPCCAGSPSPRGGGELKLRSTALLPRRGRGTAKRWRGPAAGVAREAATRSSPPASSSPSRRTGRGRSPGPGAPTWWPAASPG